MNDADKKLINAWRTKTAHTYGEHCYHEGRWTTYNELFAAFDRALADANKEARSAESDLSHYQGWNGDCRCCSEDCPI